ncbi:MAG: hypothetical protein IKC17_01735 [Bacteroidales bacterium]|nr:hypothetical protein [Bacteroidales bacterium]
MKKIFTLIAVAVIALSSCTKEVTQVNGDTLPTKAIVTGHARFCTVKQDGTLTTPDIVDKGTLINIMYGTPDKEGNIDFAYKSTTTDKDGYFEVELGCPVGKSITVKVNASMMEDSYAATSNGSMIMTEAYLFGEVSKTIPSGDIVYFDLILLPAANVGEPGLTQP